MNTLDMSLHSRCLGKSLTLASLLAAQSIAMFGCGEEADSDESGGASGAPGASDTTDTTAAGDTGGTGAAVGSIDPCGLLTTQELEAASGVEFRFEPDESDVQESNGNLLGSCTWANVGGTGVTLLWTRWGEDVNDDAWIDGFIRSQSEDSGFAAEELSVEGHRSSWAVDEEFSNGTLTIFFDLRNTITIGLVLERDLDEQRQIALDVAAIALPRI